MSSNVGKETASGKIRAARLSALQFEVLIQFMQEHPHFAVGRANGGSYSKDEHDMLWRTLSATLNETEGPIKSVTKWQKCWVDLKSNARSRAAKFRALSLDGPLLSGSMFTQWDEQVLRLLDDIAANGNKFVPVAQSPLQLLEVGFSDKVMKVSDGNHVPKAVKHKFRSIAPKSLIQCQNGYHLGENGTETIESVSSHEYNQLDDTREVEDDVEDLIPDVKSEGEDEWLESRDSGRCDEDYPADPSTPRNDPDSHVIGYLHPHILASPEGPDNVFPASDTPKKRKRDDSSLSYNVEDSLERLSKKLCGTLDRMAVAAEEANVIQQGMVSAVNRLASSFEQLLPVIAKVLSNNLTANAPS